MRGEYRHWQVVALSAVVLGGCGAGNVSTAPTTSSLTTEAWSSVLAPGGASSRSFTVVAPGTTSVTLMATDALPIRVGLGVGLPRTTGGGCRLGASVSVIPGTTPQIEVDTEAGQYCVQVFDPGTLSAPVGFAIQIAHP